MTTLAARTTAPAPAAPVTPVLRTRTRSHKKAWNVGATVFIWLSSLFVVALWVWGGGVTAVLGFNGETLTTLGRLTGLVASNLLLYQVLLMARIPFFERGFGRDEITRMHRFVGFWSFWLIMAHIVLLVLGYAATAAINPFVQLWQFVWDYPGMLLATVATLCIIMVVVTSIRRARRRIRYESWHLLHLYAYLGVGLALPHQLWTGADFLSSPAATFYWWALWAAAAASVIVFRFGMPLLSSLRHDIRVASVTADGARGVTVQMTGRRLDRLNAQAGQFFVWRFLDGPGWTRGHPFSLASAPTAAGLSISARYAGDGTRRLASMRPGTKVMIEGPYGHMTGEVRGGTKLLMIGAGAGVAPLVSLLEEQQYAPGDATLIARDSVADDALRVDAIADLVARRGLRHVPLVGSRSTRNSPWISVSHNEWRGAHLIQYLAPDLGEYDVYVCGPIPWMKHVTRDLKRAGVEPERIHSEAFTV
ncbi:putative ferric reductase [Microbacterium endophyticum]|uniref:Putative ferric reductase n=1 Tax=Microbacterium endophyticum TaxID=1526412 RepID=A0A7W4V1V3_9MICO|nr:ferredoxin reductase family protein [Microbacterium endophyticum]MBB2975194.1 putative ferric reductase [Microbacterium endophyticum]NIK37594.1 putative ferric reductase [Microbacterium endophyticum]